MAKPDKSVLITGASTGIGFATAGFMAKKGWRVFAGVRKDADAQRVSEISGRVTPVMIDVTDGAAVERACDQVKAALDGAALSGLVNNAGVAVAGPLLHLPIEEMQRQLEINVTGQLRVVQGFVPLMIPGKGANPSAKGAGRVVNISSVAGLNATPLVTPYACSKFALEALTQGLRRELMLYGIDCVAINPGPIRTPIWDKAEELDPEQYRSTDYAGALDKILAYMLSRGKTGLPPERVARAVHAALTDRTPKLNTIVTPEPVSHWLLNTLPRRSADKLIAKRLGLTPDALNKDA